MAHRLILAALLVCFLAGCGEPSTDTTAPPADASGCTDPPPAELEPVSELPLEIDPDPVPAGETASLSIGLPESVAAEWIVGVDTYLECWDGSEWVEIYLLLKGDGDPLPLGSDVTITIPAVGLLIPETFEIDVPEIEPGIYRIKDRAIIGADHPSAEGLLVIEIIG